MMLNRKGQTALAHTGIIITILLFMSVVIYFAGILTYEVTTDTWKILTFKGANIITSFQYNPLIDIIFGILFTALIVEGILIVRGI